MRRALKWIAYGLLALLPVIVMAAAGGRYWIASDGGRAFIATQAKSAGVTLTGLDGDPLGRLTVARAEVADDAGAWMIVEDAVVHWRARTLFSYRLEIEEIAAKRLEIARAPISDGTAESEPSGGIERPPVDLSLYKLAVEEIVLGPELTGAPASLTVEARASLTGPAASADVRVKRLDAPGEALLQVTYDLDINLFDLFVRANEPAGGLAEALLGLTGGIDMALEGVGDLSGWDGVFTAKTGEADIAKLKLDIARRDGEVALSIDGPVTVDRLIPADAAALVGASLDLSLRAALKEDGSEARVERLLVATAPLDVTANGRIDLQAGAIEAAVETTRIDADLLAKLAPGVDIAEPRLSATASGSIDAPSVEAALIADGVTVDDVSVSAIRLQANADGREDGAFDWRAKADVAAILLGDAALDDVLQGEWSINAKGSLDPATDSFPFDATASGDVVSASFTGIASADGAVSGKADVRLADLAKLRPLAGVLLSGPGSAAAGVEFGAEGLDLSDIAVDGVGVQLVGKLAIDAAFANLNGAFAVAAPDLARPAKLVGAPIAGALAGDVTITGPVADPTSAGDVRFRRLAVAGQTFDAVRVRFEAATLASGPKGRVVVDASTPYGAIDAATGFDLVRNALRLTGVQATAPGAQIKGALAVDLNTTVATGDLALDVSDLAAAGRPFGVEIAGSGDGVLALRAARGGQGVDAKVALKDVRGFDLAVAAIDLTAEGALDGGPLKATLSVDGLAAADAKVERLQVELQGPLTNADINLTASGAASGQSFDAAVAGALAITDAGQRFRLASAKGRVAGEAWSIAEGLIAANGPEGLSLSNLDLKTTGVALEADAAMSDGGVLLDLKRAEADLAQLSKLAPDLPASGGVSLSGRIEGSLANPEGRIVIQGREIAVVEYQERHVFGLDGAATLSDGTLGIDIQGSGLGPEPVRIAGTIGLERAAEGPPTPGPTSPLDLNLAWSGPLQPLVAIAPLDDHRLRAEGVVDLTIAGTIGRPNIRGSIVLSDGRYEHLDFGTTLAFDRIEVLADGGAIVLTPLTAKAGAGTLAVSARAEMDGARGYPFALEANLDNARLAARDDVTASASGEARVTSGLDGMDVFARIVTNRIEVELVDNLPASIPTLAVTEIGALPPGRKASEQEAAADRPPIRLDVEVSIPDKFFVRGRGLESEWNGEIAVAGEADAPVVTGQLDLKRGSFDIVGKRLALTEGNVRIEPDASQRLEAVVDVLAEYEGADFTVGARVNGPATDPEIELTSTPELPRDEILARLLFNKNAGALTAEESLQLAAAAASLVGGGGGGFDPVGDIRRATGIDALRVDVGGEAGPAVEAGKYLTDDIYVGVRQGAAAGTGAVSVEVEVFDSVTLESEAAQDGSQKVGARLKWDY